MQRNRTVVECVPTLQLKTSFSDDAVNLTLLSHRQVRSGLSDRGVERRHRGPSLQLDSPPLYLPVGLAAFQLCGRPPVAAAHLPLSRLHEGPGGAVQGLPIAAAHGLQEEGS